MAKLLKARWVEGYSCGNQNQYFECLVEFNPLSSEWFQVRIGSPYRMSDGTPSTSWVSLWYEGIVSDTNIDSISKLFKSVNSKLAKQNAKDGNPLSIGQTVLRYLRALGVESFTAKVGYNEEPREFKAVDAVWFVDTWYRKACEDCVQVA